MAFYAKRPTIDYATFLQSNPRANSCDFDNHIKEFARLVRKFFGDASKSRALDFLSIIQRGGSMCGNGSAGRCKIMSRRTRKSRRS